MFLLLQVSRNPDKREAALRSWRVHERAFERGGFRRATVLDGIIKCEMHACIVMAVSLMTMLEIKLNLLGTMQLYT